MALKSIVVLAQLGLASALAPGELGNFLLAIAFATYLAFWTELLLAGGRHSASSM